MSTLTWTLLVATINVNGFGAESIDGVVMMRMDSEVACAKAALSLSLAEAPGLAPYACVAPDGRVVRYWKDPPPPPKSAAKVTKDALAKRLDKGWLNELLGGK